MTDEEADSVENYLLCYAKLSRYCDTGFADDEDAESVTDEMDRWWRMMTEEQKTEARRRTL